MTQTNTSDTERLQRHEAGPRAVAVAADPGHVRRIVYFLAATLAALTAYTLSRLAAA